MDRFWSPQLFFCVFIMWFVTKHRVTTHLENLEKSGKMEKVREKSGSEIRCVFSISKYSAPDPYGGAYNAPPDP